jgi:hypothetical protein
VSRSDEARETLAYALGVQAYVWGYAPWEMEQSRKKMTAVPEPVFPPGLTPMNQFVAASDLLDASFTAVPGPNNDTFYSAFWLDTSTEPMVLKVPEISDRYYTFQFVDAYTNNFHYIAQRTQGSSREASYAICAPG